MAHGDSLMNNNTKKNNSKKIKKNITPGSLGSIIKSIRELKGMTMKETGEKAGYKTSTADVRIAQYESNSQAPRDEALENLANALNVNKDALIETDLTSNNKMYHTLFMLRQLHGLHPEKENDNYYLSFDKNTDSYDEYIRFLSEWYEKYEESHHVLNSDTPESIQYKENNLKLWEYEYSAKIDNNDSLTQSDAEKIQFEIDRTNEKKYGLKYKKKLDNVLEKQSSHIKEVDLDSYQMSLIGLASQTIALIKTGVQVEKDIINYYDDTLSEKSIIAFNLSDILSSENVQKEFAYFYNIINNINQKTLDEITPYIVCKNGTFFVAFFCLDNCADKYMIINEELDEMFYLGFYINTYDLRKNSEYLSRRQDFFAKLYVLEEKYK